MSIKDLSGCQKTEDRLRKRNEELLNRNRELEIIRDELIASRKSFYQSVQGSDIGISEQDLKAINTYGRWSYKFKEDMIKWAPEVKDIVGHKNTESCISIEKFRDRNDVYVPHKNVCYTSKSHRDNSNYDNLLLIRLSWRVCEILKYQCCERRDKIKSNKVFIQPFFLLQCFTG